MNFTYLRWSFRARDQEPGWNEFSFVVFKARKNGFLSAYMPYVKALCFPTLCVFVFEREMRSKGWRNGPKNECEHFMLQE